MVTLVDFHYPQSRTLDFATYDGVTPWCYDSEEIPVTLADLIRKGEYIYMNDLSFFLTDVLQVLFSMGLHPIEGNPTERKMQSKTFKYLINGDFQCYSITVKMTSRTVAHIVNANNMLAINHNDTIIDTWTTDDDGTEPERLAIGFYRAIELLLKEVDAQQRIPVTLSGCARRIWNRTIDNESYKFLRNANNIKVSRETLEHYCRRAYHGGLCINNITDANNIIDKHGYVLDINSLYSFIMKNKPMPYGEPHIIDGQPTDELVKEFHEGYIYIFVKIKIFELRLKPNGVPCIQLEHNNPDKFLHQLEWLQSSQVYDYRNRVFVDNPDYDNVTLVLTYTDFVLLQQNYEFRKIEYINYVWFPATVELFHDYVDTYFERKQRATTKGQKRVSKMLLNSLSGNMARLPEYENVVLIETKNGFQTTIKKSKGASSYIYIGCAITSYAREYLIKHILPIIDNPFNGIEWLYSDTDSIHLTSDNDRIPEYFVIGDGLGEWKVEKQFDNAVYYAKKMYGFKFDGDYNFTLAGIPRDDALFYRDILKGDISNSFNTLDIVDPSLYRLKDYEWNAVENQFKGEVDNDDIEVLDWLDKKGNAAFRRFSFLTDKVAKDKNPLLKIYFSKLPITQRIHGKDFFTDDRIIQWRQLSDFNIY